MGLTGCSECHSQHGWSNHDAPLLSGAEGGGQWMDMANLPGHVVAPNISPDPEAGAGTWTDDQLARAIGEGIDHDSRALFPMMPYEDFRHMSDEDLASIVVYPRSLPAVHNHWSKTKIIFPVKYLIRSVPEPLTAPVAAPLRADGVEIAISRRFRAARFESDSCDPPRRPGVSPLS